MEIKSVPTPVGELDLYLNFYPKELKEPRYREVPEDEVTITLQTRNSTNSYGEPDNRQWVAINGIEYSFRYSLTLKTYPYEEGQPKKFGFSSLSANRRDIPFGDITPGAREKITRLDNWVNDWMRDKKHLIHQAREEALYSGIKRLRETASEKRIEAMKIDEKANELEALIGTSAAV